METTDGPCSTLSNLIPNGSAYDCRYYKTEQYNINEKIASIPHFSNPVLYNDVKAYVTTCFNNNDINGFDYYVTEGKDCHNFIFYDNENPTSINKRFIYITDTDYTKRTLVTSLYPNVKIVSIAKRELELSNYSDEDILSHSYAGFGGIYIHTNDEELFLSDYYLVPTKNIKAHANQLKYRPAKVGEKVIALTFDDGPNPKTTPALLDMLQEKGVKATFFTIGKSAEASPSIIKRIADGGHDIGIHSYGHSNYANMSAVDVQNDIYKCYDIIFNATGIKPYLVRAPYGNINNTYLDYNEYFFINWNVDPLDWKYQDRYKVSKNILDTVKDGSIILLHDIYKTSCDAAEDIIDNLSARGFRFVTISELYDLEGKIPEGKIYYSRDNIK